MVNATPRPLCPGNGHVYIIHETGWAGRVRKISPPTGIRSPDRQARGESLNDSFRGEILEMPLTIRMRRLKANIKIDVSFMRRSYFYV